MWGSLRLAPIMYYHSIASTLTSANTCIYHYYKSTVLSYKYYHTYFLNIFSEVHKANQELYNILFYSQVFCCQHGNRYKQNFYNPIADTLRVNTLGLRSFAGTSFSGFRK